MSYNETKVALLSSDVCNPPTYLHLRMFERAKKYVNVCMNKHVTEGILHVNNFFPSTTEKEDFISNDQRFKLAKLCCRRSKWIKADNWKVTESNNILSYFISLLLHYQTYYDNEFGKNMVKIMFICDNNFFYSLKSFQNNNNFEKFLLNFNIIVISISSSQNLTQNVLTTNFLKKYKNNLFFVKDFFDTQFSTSQEIREALKNNETIRYCTEHDVVDYIEKYMLYKRIPKLLNNGSQTNFNVSTQCNKRCLCSIKKKDKEKFSDCNIMLESYPNYTTSSHLQKETEPIWTSVLKNDYKKSKSLEKLFNNGEHTPIYDNLTIEEMLEANERWVSEMLKQASELELDIKTKRPYQKKVSFSDENDKKVVNEEVDNMISTNCVKLHNDKSNTKQNFVNDVETFLSMYDSLNLSTKAKLSNIHSELNEMKFSTNVNSDHNADVNISFKNTVSNTNDSVDEKNFALESTV